MQSESSLHLTPFMQLGQVLLCAVHNLNKFGGETQKSGGKNTLLSGDSVVIHYSSVSRSLNYFLLKGCQAVKHLSSSENIDITHLNCDSIVSLAADNSQINSEGCFIVYNLIGRKSNLFLDNWPYTVYFDKITETRSHC